MKKISDEMMSKMYFFEKLNDNIETQLFVVWEMWIRLIRMQYHK